MSSFQFKYNSSRAEDIINGVDPVVFAGATTLRGLSLPLLSVENDESSNNSSRSKNVYLGIRPEKTIESQFQISRQVAGNEAISSLKSQFSKDHPEESKTVKAADPFVVEALSRGFSIRRQRENQSSVGSPVVFSEDFQCQLLLTSSEITRLQNGIAANYHQSQSRSESKTLYEKLSERLAIQRANFVNNMIKTEREKVASKEVIDEKNAKSKEK